MRKTILQLILLLAPCAAFAQSEWEAPVDQKAQNQLTEKKQSDSKKPSSAVKQAKMKIDQKYAAGAVPVVNGKVEWTADIACDGMNADTCFEKILSAIQAMTKEKCQTEKSRIAAMNRKEHIIAANFDEEMIFSSTSFAKDFTEFRYTLIAKCTDGNVNMSISRINYHYEKGRETEAVYTAEEWITDSEALNKKGTNLYRTNGKFRKKTIDRKDEIFKFLREYIILNK